MKVIRANKIIAFDVDDVLISEESQYVKNTIIDCFNQKTPVYVNEEMINKIKEHHSLGSFIIVWSQQGHEWSEAVVIALGLTNHVDLVMAKVSECYDDLSINEWMKLNKVVLK